MAAEASAFAEHLLELLGPRGDDEATTLRAAVSEVLAGATAQEVESFLERLANTGAAWAYEPPHPLARRLNYGVMDNLLEPPSRIEGAQKIAGAPLQNLVLVANHLSFVDANVLQHLLARAGLAELAERLTVIVGPKVFSQPLRRIASLCFGTIKTPQSTTRASGEALMAPRDVARVAQHTLSIARDRLHDGDALLVFVEGTRSRTSSMQRTLAGVARYLLHDSAICVPVALVGSEKLAPLGDTEHLQRAEVRARVGRPIACRVLVERCRAHRTLLMDVVGFMIADCLEPSYRGFYATASNELHEARAIADTLR